MIGDEARAFQLAKSAGFRIEFDPYSGEAFCRAPSIGDNLAEMLVKLVFAAQADQLDDGK